MRPLAPSLPYFFSSSGLEDAEGHGGLGGGAGLGDDVDGEIPVAHQLQHLQQRIGGQAVAREVDVRGILFLQIIVGGASDQVDDGPGAQIGAADADDHQSLGVRLDLLPQLL